MGFCMGDPMTVHALIALMALTPCFIAPVPKEAGSTNYIILPLTTELQRQVLTGEHTCYYVLVNGDGVVKKDGDLRAEAIDLRQLDHELTEDPLLSKDTGILIVVAYTREAPFRGMQLLRYALIGVGHSRFKEVRVVSARDSRDSWKNALTIIGASGKAKESDVPEACVKKGLVKVYPVRTAISRYLTDKADCVVVIGDQRGPSPKVEVIPAQAGPIAEALRELKVKNRERIRFEYGRLPRGKEALMQFEKANQELAKKLGFKHDSVVGY
jgi:hypothetical protein